MRVRDAQIRLFVQVVKLRKKIQVSRNTPNYYLVVSEVAAKLKGVKNVILVLSGKGGVGKSTVAT